MKYLKKNFGDMEPYFSKMITDGIILNANESPFNPPQKILDEFHSLLTSVDYNRYPDMAEEALRDELAKSFGVNSNNITVGVGSDELLDVTFRAVLNEGDNVIGFSPSFSMYKVFADLSLANYIPIYGDENYVFKIDDMISAIKKYNPKISLICSPNNPTGQYISKEDVRRVIESTNNLVILDLAYIDFAKEDYSNIALEYDNVIVFRTFSKAMALPSIRCGYAISQSDNIDMINAVKAPYSVTTLTQMLALIAIKNKALYEPQIKEIIKERERLSNELKKLGFNPLDSESNFLFVVMEDKYNDVLLQNKIYIRKFKTNIYRITVGSYEENNKLLEVLKNEIK